jgi:predicted ATP-dependent endonuclease of OLD family
VIKRVQIQNFRALLEIDVELRPLAVLVGPNDSGKSSFLEAIRRRLTGSIEREDGWRGVQQAVVQLYGTQGSPFRGSAEIFKLPSQGIPMESAGVAEEPRKGAPQLTVDGSNLAAFLDYPLRKDRRRFD